MSYSATITDPHEPDAMPMWESFDHPNLDDALQAARAHIHATQPDDVIVDEGHGGYAIWTGPASAARVAVLVIAPTDDSRSQESANPTSSAHRHPPSPVPIAIPHPRSPPCTR